MNTCYIVDDQMHEIEGLSYFIDKTEGLELIGWDTDPVVALNKILSGAVKADILFLDIDMAEMNGISFSRQIGGSPAIIFVTAFSNYAVDAFAVGAVDYLPKPIDPARFLVAIERARERIKGTGRDSKPREITVKTATRCYEKIELAELMWVEVRDKCLFIYCANDRRVIVSSSLVDFKKKLPEDSFMRVHKSYIVSRSYIKEIAFNRVILKDGTPLEVGPRFLDKLYKWLDVER